MTCKRKPENFFSIEDSKVYARILCGLYFSSMLGFSGPPFASKNCPHFFYTIMFKKVEIGPIIRQKLKEKSYPPAKFARDLGCSPKSVGNRI